MSGLEFALVVVAGAVGAGLRSIVDGVVQRGRPDAFPLGIAIVNASGAVVLGVLTGLGATIGAEWLAVAGIGLLGGYTTFSTVMVETVLLGRRGRRSWAWMNLIGTFVVALVSASLGAMIGGVVPR
ncbi:fluoride efflux transporter FluC [Microbacterium sp.]|uniref:fluoride efflux transporter FluC n=1 Tax=Microbacterium sp. TaxID=51671 RepID=UPI003A8C81E9